jgi:hypothetical protein
MERKMENKTSLQLAHEIAVQSYGQILSRITANEQGIRTQMGWATTLILGIFVLIVQTSHCGLEAFYHCSFIVSLSAFILATSCILIALNAKTIKLLDPKKHYEGWLDIPSDDFMKYTVKDAGEDFQHNKELNVFKFWAGNVFSTILYAIAIIALILWSMTLSTI